MKDANPLEERLAKEERSKEYERIEKLVGKYRLSPDEPLSNVVRRLVKTGVLKAEGETLSFTKYLDFQLYEASPVELEVAIALERAIMRGELARPFSKVLLYAIAAVLLIIGAGIGVYILRDVLK